jgi:propanol-preferring alcohol dehydrogenase
MWAMVFEKKGFPLQLKEIPIPNPAKDEVLIKIHACAVCRTDLHIVDGELPNPKPSLVPGHQIVGTIVKTGDEVQHIKIGHRIGVPWLAKSCGTCKFCLNNQENLCDNALFTGYNVDGGFAEYCTAHAGFILPLPESYSDTHAAPLLCGGLIGFRSYKMVRNCKRIGFYGFGSSAHLIIQVALKEGHDLFVFTRKGDEKAQNLAKKLGAVWAGHSEENPPVTLDGAIIFAPVGSLVPAALRAVDKGGIVVCAGIHMSDIPAFPYDILWGERTVRSVANLTRQDGREFLTLAPQIPIQTQVVLYPLAEANQALSDLRNGSLIGTAVLTM